MATCPEGTITPEVIAKTSGNMVNFNNWAEGDETTIIDFNGTLVPSPLKALIEGTHYKPYISWATGLTVNDLFQSYSYIFTIKDPKELITQVVIKRFSFFYLLKRNGRVLKLNNSVIN